MTEASRTMKGNKKFRAMKKLYDMICFSTAVIPLFIMLDLMNGTLVFGMLIHAVIRKIID